MTSGDPLADLIDTLIQIIIDAILGQFKPIFDLIELLQQLAM